MASILEKVGVLIPQETAATLALAGLRNCQFGGTILAEKMVAEEILAEVLSQWLRLLNVKLAATTIDPKGVRTIAEELVRKDICLRLTREEDKGGASTCHVRRRPVLIVAMVGIYEATKIGKL